MKIFFVYELFTMNLESEILVHHITLNKYYYLLYVIKTKKKLVQML